MADILLHHGYITLCFPLLAFVVIGLWMCRKSQRASGLTALALAGFAAMSGLATAWVYFREVIGRPEFYPGKTIIAGQYDWLNFTP
ncbi:MAG: hypothetical protein OEV64_15470, partial [Desulfobulbaceae bacterium]|nr:hypothetical protein [Desulfobulbaceae bacterium]